MGPTLQGETRADGFGWGLSLNDAGDVLAVGSARWHRPNDTYDTNQGRVRVYQYNGFDQWNQIGQDLYGARSLILFGSAVSLSMDVNTPEMAVGAYKSNGYPGYNREKGEVRVYRYDYTTSEWKPKGQVLYGGSSFHQFGKSISLSSVSGGCLAVGSPGARNVQVFRFSSLYQNWTHIGPVIETPINPSQLGVQVGMSADGRTVAAADNKAGDNGQGLVRFFRLNP